MIIEPQFNVFNNVAGLNHGITSIITNIFNIFKCDN